MNNYLPTDYQSFIHTSRYAKYFDGKGRESWSETVDRYMVMLWVTTLITKFTTK